MVYTHKPSLPINPNQLLFKSQIWFPFFKSVSSSCLFFIRDRQEPYFLTFSNSVFFTLSSSLNSHGHLQDELPELHEQAQRTSRTPRTLESHTANSQTWQLAVTSCIHVQSQPHPGWGVWPDLCHDDKVSYMEDLITTHQPFGKYLWHGGDTSCPLSSKTPSYPKKELRPRKTSNKPSTSRKQKRISSYFQAAASSSNSNDKLMEVLSELSDTVSNLQKETKLLRLLLKRPKTPTYRKRIAFHSLLARTKKVHQSHRGCQTEPSDMGFAQSPTRTFPVPMEEDTTLRSSPVVSQYAAQHYVSPKATKTTPSNTTNLQPEPLSHSPDHPSPLLTPITSSPVHTTPEQQNPPINDSPVHTSPNNTPPTHTSGSTSPIHTSENTSHVHTKSFHTPEPKSPVPHTTLAIYDASHHPNSPPVQSLLFRAVGIFQPLSPDPPSLSQPRYDSSANQASQNPLPYWYDGPVTPQPSPSKTSDSLQGFISHAAVLNAFSATASPQAPLSTPRSLRSNQKAHQSVVTEAVEVSDGEEPKHIPDRYENLLAKDLRSCKDIPPQSLIAPLPWKQWDHFCRVVAQIKHV
ncbi:unnamed protein product [Eruca vesicaria subsp. sativa]|uniref:Uncharacterized protein n=1 Tax=Eruca vesicaria subsp. sativa TaxID=29727 RepID=A0ABC8KKE0_ERUVS|nr:unnamed protein product [Eruca vesicaria subsp. sativa]